MMGEESVGEREPAQKSRPVYTSMHAVIHGQRESLLWGVLGEINTLLNVALKSINTSLDELLLTLGHAVKDVNGLLGTVRLYWACQFNCPSKHLKIEDLRRVQREWRRTQHRWPWQWHHRHQHRAGRRK